MKLCRAAISLFVTLNGGLAYAQDQIIEFDQPGIFWVATDLGDPAKQGLTIPLLNYVTFENGNFRDGFAGKYRAAVPIYCMPYDGRCPEEQSIADHYKGAYDLTESGVVLSDVIRTNYIFDRGEANVEIDASTFYRSATVTPPSFKDGIMQVSTANGPLRYVPLTQSGFDKVFGLAAVLDYQVSMHEFATCFVEGMHGLEHKNPSDRSVLDQQINAYASLGVREIQRSKRIQPLYFISDRDKSEAERNDFEGLEMIDAAVRIYFEAVISKFGEQDGPLSQVQRIEISDTADPMVSSLVQDLSPGAKAVFTANWDDLYDDMITAAPLLAALKAERTTLQDTICPQL